MGKIFLNRALPHVIAIAVFACISMAYFSPALDDYVLRQSDTTHFKGMSKEIVDHREIYDEEPLWTSSMFGGMPATFVSVKYPGDVLGYIESALTLWLPNPINLLFLYMLGFYILLILLKADPWLAAVGAVAYGMSTYLFIILGAGHNTKAMAIAYMAPTIGAILLTLRGNWMLGGVLTALFMALQIRANHLQITYYMGFVVAALVIYHVAKNMLNKDMLKPFLRSVGVMAIAVLLAVCANVTKIYSGYEYSEYSIRGGKELTIKSDAQKRAEEEVKANDSVAESGLDLDYMTRWSYGKQESWSLLFPNVKGGASGVLAQTEEFEDIEDADELKQFAQLDLYLASISRGRTGYINTYWGDQPGTSGPVYIGAIVCFLFILAMVFMTGALKWTILVLSMIILMLAWGKNYMGLTEWFAANFPLYSKFRAVTILLTVLEFTIPFLAFVWLIDVVRKREEFKEGSIDLLRSLSWINGKYSPANVIKKSVTNKRLYIISSAAVILILGFIWASPSSFFDFMSQGEKESFNEEGIAKKVAIAQQTDPQQMGALMSQVGASSPEEMTMVMTRDFGKVKTQLVDYRKGVFKADLGRSIGFIVLAAILIYLLMFTAFDKRIILGVLGLFVIVDLWPVDTRYLNNDESENEKGYDYKNWQTADQKLMPYDASQADQAIKKREKELDKQLEPGLSKGLEVKMDSAWKARADESDMPNRWRERLEFGVLNHNTNYRVLNSLAALDSDGRTPYYHKAIGGYHGAKLRRYQDLVEFYLSEQSQLAQNPNNLAGLNVLNMLNTRYVIRDPSGNHIINMDDPATLQMTPDQKPGVFLNPHAFGNAWFANHVEVVENPDAEIQALARKNLKDSIVMDKRFEGELKGWTPTPDPDARIDLVNFKPNHLTYKVSNMDSEQVAVFSEVFYPLGWQCYIDGKPVSHFRVNYILRAVRVPAGAEKIEFKYELESFGWTSTLATTGGILIIILLLYVLYRETRISLAENETVD